MTNTPDVFRLIKDNQYILFALMVAAYLGLVVAFAFLYHTVRFYRRADAVRRADTADAALTRLAIRDSCAATVRASEATIDVMRVLQGYSVLISAKTGQADEEVRKQGTEVKAKIEEVKEQVCHIPAKVAEEVHRQNGDPGLIPTPIELQGVWDGSERRAG